VLQWLGTTRAASGDPRHCKQDTRYSRCGCELRWYAAKANRHYCKPAWYVAKFGHHHHYEWEPTPLQRFVNTTSHVLQWRDCDIVRAAMGDRNVVCVCNGRPQVRVCCSGTSPCLQWVSAIRVAMGRLLTPFVFAMGDRNIVRVEWGIATSPVFLMGDRNVIRVYNGRPQNRPVLQ
jgi:hypothetical protein